MIRNLLNGIGAILALIGKAILSPARYARRTYRTPEFWLQLAAYAIPLCFLLYVLYINFLPFGFSHTYTIQVGAPGDDDASKAFYLEPSPDLSDATTTANGTPYRTLDGAAEVVFNPGVVLKNAQITVTVQSDPAGSVQVIPPTINFDPNSVKWDYDWNFSTSSPSDLTGNAFHFDNCEYFNGSAQLQLPNSSQGFDSGPFTVYAEWIPQDQNGDFQEIVGHYNWELLQNKDSVEFLIGRMDDATGPQYSITYPIKSNFFNTEHSALAIYNPSQNGYIELYVDGNFAGQVYFGPEVIWKAYNGNKNLSFGWTPHNNNESPYFQGCISQVSFVDQSLASELNPIVLTQVSGSQITIPVTSSASSSISSIRLNVHG